MDNCAESYRTIQNRANKTESYRTIKNHAEPYTEPYRIIENHTDSVTTPCDKVFSFICVGHIEHFGFNPVNRYEFHSSQIQFNIIQLRLNLRRAIFMFHHKNSVRISNLPYTWYLPRTSHDQTNILSYVLLLSNLRLLQPRAQIPSWRTIPYRLFSNISCLLHSHPVEGTRYEDNGRSWSLILR